MTDAPELLPCPFCGGAAEIWRAQEGRTAWIGCMGRCSVLVSKEYKTDAEAVTAWNTRADAAEALRLRDELASGSFYKESDIDAMQDEIARLREALRAMVEEQCDYMRINHLGDPERQHNIKLARAALGDGNG